MRRDILLGTVLTNRSDNHEEPVIFAAKKVISLGSVPTSRTGPLEVLVMSAMLMVISPEIALIKKKVAEVVVIAALDLKKEVMARTGAEEDSVVVVGVAEVEAVVAVVPDLIDTHETAKPE
jgi:hypothetical protein